MIWLLLTAAGLLHAGTLPERPPCRVTPRLIQVGAFYDGADLRIEGVAAPGARVIVTVTGPDREEAFNRKARFGPVWLNAGKVRISGAPSLFLRFSSQPASGLAPGFDEASLAARLHLSPASPDRRADASLRADYLALKKADGVYAFHESGVTLAAPGPAGAPYNVRFRWPKKAPPAEYRVHVFEVRPGEPMAESVYPLLVVRTGFPAWLAGMAENRASLYGITAVLIGALAGFGIDFLTTRLFGRKRSVVH